MHKHLRGVAVLIGIVAAIIAAAVIVVARSAAQTTTASYGPGLWPGQAGELGPMCDTCAKKTADCLAFEPPGKRTPNGCSYPPCSRGGSDEKLICSACRAMCPQTFPEKRNGSTSGAPPNR